MLSLALLSGEILKSLTFAGVLALAGVASGLAIRLALAGVDAITVGSGLSAFISRISGVYQGTVGQREQGSN